MEPQQPKEGSTQVWSGTSLPPSLIAAEYALLMHYLGKKPPTPPRPSRVSRWIHGVVVRLKSVFVKKSTEAQP